MGFKLLRFDSGYDAINAEESLIVVDAPDDMHSKCHLWKYGPAPKSPEYEQTTKYINEHSAWLEAHKKFWISPITREDMIKYCEECGIKYHLVESIE